MGLAEAIVILLALGAWVALFAGIAIGVLVVWRAASGRLARRSGWVELGSRYPAAGPVPAGSIWLGVVRIGGVPYQNVVRGAGTPEGLRLDVLAPFARGIPSVLVPWQDVLARPATAHQTSVELGAVTTLTLATQRWQRLAPPAGVMRGA